MTARVALSCDGVIFPAGYDCRQATPVGSPSNGAAARATARVLHRWAVATDAAGRLLDLCPGCAEVAARHPERGLRLLPGVPAFAPRHDPIAAEAGR